MIWKGKLEMQEYSYKLIKSALTENKEAEKEENN